MQQVKAWYIYILGVKRLVLIIKSWITRKLLSFSQSGRLESPKSRLSIFKWQDRLTNKSFLNLSYREHRLTFVTDIYRISQNWTLSVFYLSEASSKISSMQVLELVKYYILEFELRVVRLRIIFIRKISKLIPTVVVNW
jgi:hypothetical protein